MLFIKFLKQHLTQTYAALTLLGKLLLTLQIASMFVPIIEPTADEQSWLALSFFFISVIMFIPINTYLVAKYCSFVVDSFDEPIDDKRFLKLITTPFIVLAIISFLSMFLTERIAIIQYVCMIPGLVIICGHIAKWLNDLPDIKLPKLNIRKLFIKDKHHE